jgi:hypothetical protein
VRRRPSYRGPALLPVICPPSTCPPDPRSHPLLGKAHCLADVAQLRAAPEVFGPVASDPTVSRLIDALAADAPAALAGLSAALCKCVTG